MHASVDRTIAASVLAYFARELPTSIFAHTTLTLTYSCTGETVGTDTDKAIYTINKAFSAHRVMTCWAVVGGYICWDRSVWGSRTGGHTCCCLRR